MGRKQGNSRINSRGMQRRFLLGKSIIHRQVIVPFSPLLLPLYGRKTRVRKGPIHTFSLQHESFFYMVREDKSVCLTHVVPGWHWREKPIGLPEMLAYSLSHYGTFYVVEHYLEDGKQDDHGPNPIQFSGTNAAAKQHWDKEKKHFW